MIAPPIWGILGGVVGAIITACTNYLTGRNKPHADRLAGDASQIQAILASATYWEGQAKRFQSEAEVWQTEASEWHERFYRGLTDIKVLGQAQQTIHQITTEQFAKGTRLP